MAISREQYLEHGWDMKLGFIDAAKRAPNRFTHADAGQAKRAARDPAKLKAMFRQCWDGSDSQAGFAAALHDQGFVLARGDRRGVVAVDQAGKVWSPSRWCGVTSRELKAKTSDLDQLPDVTAAKQIAKDLQPSGNQHERPEDGPYRKKLDDLIRRQREDRARLLDARRQQDAERMRQKPRGFKSAFLKLTVRYAAFVKQCEEDTAQVKAQAVNARQALIDRQLQERRAFERDNAKRQPEDRKERAERVEPQQEQETLSADRVTKQPDLVLAEISKTKASFTRTDVLRELSRWVKDPATLSKTANAALTSSESVKLSSDLKTRYTTRDYQKAETKLQSAAERLAASRSVTVSSHHVAAALNAQNKTMTRAFGGQLSDEQTRAIKSVLCTERLSQVVGLAGAGKSAMLATAVDAWRRQGVTVHGAALAGKAADRLQASAGIPSRTLA